MDNLKVSELYCYPIKGCAGISLNSAIVEDRGLQYDRRWMLVDVNNQFISQRSHKKMAIIKISFETDCLAVRYEGMDSLRIPYAINTGESVEVSVWDDQVVASLVGSTFDQWFSKVLEDDIRLVCMNTESTRAVDKRYAQNNEQVSFADGYPFLILGQSSMDYLNDKLEEALEINRFRPNIVFTGGEPHEEDSWRDFRIGDTQFTGAKRCARCTVITINQSTAESGKEPLKTLSNYRKENNKILFGFNVMLQKGTRIEVGDTITVLNKIEGGALVGADIIK